MTAPHEAPADEKEQIAQAADKVAESFMERYRQRPIGDGERFYDLSDAFSSFAHHLRHVEACTCGWGGTHDPDNPRCAANAPESPRCDLNDDGSHR